MKKIIGYMDKTDFDHELGYDPAGTKVYPSVRAVHEDRSCTQECGIVEVEVIFRNVVQQPGIRGANKKP